MSDFDEELEEDLEDTPTAEDEADDFEDPQQTTAALTMEINKLRQKNEVLRQFNVKQKDRYKEEVRSFLSPLIQKYKDLQAENEFLKRQIKEIGQSREYLSKAKEIGENGNHEKEDFVKLMETTIQEKEHEIAVLNKMVKTLEDEGFSLKRDVAELPELKESLKYKSDSVARLEEEKFDLSSKVEAKESLTEKYLKQISDLETNVYVLNKRISERAGQFETGKVSEYESKLEKANEKVEQLNQKIHNLEKQLSDYKQTMSSLEEELEEEEFLKSPSAAGTEKLAEESEISLAKEEEPEEEEIQPAEVFDYTKLYKEEHSPEPAPEVKAEAEDEYISPDEFSADELPSDDDLLAEDIELEELSLEDEPSEEEPVASSHSMSHEDLPLEELAVEEDGLREDGLSLEAEHADMEEMPLDDDELLSIDLDKENDESFDDLSVSNLMDDELTLEDEPVASEPAAPVAERKYYDPRATNMENIKVLSELEAETSPFKAHEEPKKAAADELFDDELPLDDSGEASSENPVDELPIDIFDEDQDSFDNSVKEENKSVKS
jgi:hypothetical protein